MRSGLGRRNNVFDEAPRAERRDLLPQDPLGAARAAYLQSDHACSSSPRSTVQRFALSSGICGALSSATALGLFVLTDMPAAGPGQ